MMKMTEGKYINIFTDGLTVDLYLVFPESYDNADEKMILEAVEGYINGKDKVTKDMVEKFLNNNCDEYDVNVVDTRKNVLLYNAICYMVEQGMTASEIENYLGTTAEEIFEQSGFDLDEEREYVFDIKTTIRVTCKGGMEKAREIMECNLTDIGAEDIESYCVDEFGKECN